ncbi:kanadaptin [Drosophila bipectinata]|uniref:kanadaptin n=1 Tax=Drosophila bipectinata TaxID=42026 RepID=UPI001C897B20|nr:kanadaptin [Drosophila bipectinata]
MDEFKVPAPLPKPKTVVTEKPRTEAPAEPPPPPAPKTPNPSPNPACPYKVPKWSAPPAPEQNYSFEVLKSGQIIDQVKQLQQQAVWTFGRLPENDVAAAHPTISRFHAVLQYKPKAPVKPDETEEDEDDNAPKNEQPEGWYVYDLGSTHGTFLNKQRLPPKVFIRMRVGHMLKLGGSTRVYILQGPGEDEEPESELTVTELKEKREQEIAAAAAEKQRKILEAEERERNEGVSWGMGDDADEETDLTHNPYASTNNEDLFFDDPKKTLRGFFEREGLNLEYKCDELSTGSFVCRVELPLDDSNGRPIIVEVNHKGRKKDCVVQCALEACRTLDRHGVLRQANQESQKRKIQKSGDSDDDDEFWDRTGDVARKKQRKENAGVNVTLTYEDLLKQEQDLNEEMKKVDNEINIYQQKEKKLKEQALKQQSAGDDLDNFMDTLAEDVQQVDKTEIKKLRLEQQRLKGEQQKVQRLLKIAKPTALPFVTSNETLIGESSSTGVKKQLPMIGKRNQFSKFKVVRAAASTQPKPQSNAFASDEEEVEEEDEEKRNEAEEPRKPEEIVVAQTTEEKLEELSTTESKNLEEQEPNAKSEVSQPTIPKTEVLKPEKVTPDVTTVSSDTIASVTAPVESIKESNTSVEEDVSEQGAEDAAQKKRRQRQRQRNKQRQDVDMDLDELAEHDDSDKYAKWVPPTNQSGDGITHLNEKFGY